MVFNKVLVISRKNEVLHLSRSVARQVLVADDVTEALDIIAGATEGGSPDLFVIDGTFNQSEIKLFLTGSYNNPGVPVVVIGQTENQPEWLSQYSGIYYLTCSNDLEHFKKTITNKFESNQSFSSGNNLANEIGKQPDKNIAFSEFFVDAFAESVSIAGKSEAIHNTLKIIRIVAESNCNPVLITGETGTGKELAAKAVHILRHPKEKFIAINCAALTANLLESELFGHVKGAFTSADKEKTGLLELAGKGSVFLDEISEIPLELQAKLLRVLQEKSFRKVGGVEEIRFEATIIASSNRDLRREVRENRFRQDLYYRLDVCPINMIPLRDQRRKNDIRLLANYFLKTSTVSPVKIGKIHSFTELAMQKIEQHCWPGNIRELRNVIDRAILLEETEKIGLSSINIEPAEQVETEFQIQGNQSSCQKPFISRTDYRTNDSLDFSLEKAEKELIAKALQESGWQKTKAAALLGITRATLYAKVKQHNIQKGCFVPQTAITG